MISIRIAMLRFSAPEAIGFVCEPGRLVFEPGGFVCEPLNLQRCDAPPTYVERVCVVTTTAGALVEERESPERSTTRDESFCAADVVALNERAVVGRDSSPFDSEDA